MSTDLPLGLGEVLLDLNADRIVDVLAAGRLSDNPGKQTTEQSACIYFKVEVNPEHCVDTHPVRHTYFFHECEFVEPLNVINLRIIIHFVSLSFVLEQQQLFGMRAAQ